MHASVRTCALLIALSSPLIGGCDDETTTNPTATVFGSGQVIEVDRAVENFSALDHASVGAVHVTLGDEESLRIVAEDNLLDEIFTEVTNGVLRIRTRTGISLRPTEPIDFHLAAKVLDSVALTGVGQIDGSRLVGELLDLRIEGVGVIAFTDIEAQALVLTVSGVGDARLGGSTVDAEITVAGVGEIDAGDLSAVRCDVQVAGSALLRVRASEALAFVVSGDADLCYFGDPAVEISIAGSGTISTCEGPGAMPGHASPP